MQCPQLPDWETEAGAVQRQSPGLDSSGLGLVTLGLFSFLPGKRGSPPLKPLGDGAASPAEARDIVGRSRPFCVLWKHNLESHGTGGSRSSVPLILGLCSEGASRA